MLIDTHAHLTDVCYLGAEEIIKGMADDGLDKIVSVGYDLDSSLAAMKLAQANENVYFACGVHPSEAKSVNKQVIERLEELCSHSKCVAVGEIGLDYHYEDTDRAAQREALLMQMETVKKVKLPVIFHLRDAYGDFADIIENYGDRVTNGAVMHCFSGSREVAEHYIKKGYYISFSGSITFKNNVKAADIVRCVPEDKLLVETDCPYLTPVPFRGKLNYPAYVKYTAEKAAEFRNESVSDLARYTTDNAYAFYFKMRR